MAIPQIYEPDQVALFPVMDEDLLNTEDVKVCYKNYSSLYSRILVAAIVNVFFT